jgi:hypothetical protein
MNNYDEDDIYNGKRRSSPLQTMDEDDIGGSTEEAYRTGREAARYQSSTLAKAKRIYCKRKKPSWIEAFVKGFKFQKRYSK